MSKKHFYEKILPNSSYAPWLSDGLFNKYHNLVHRNTLIDRLRLWCLWDSLDQVKDLEGCIIEVGVWRGGSGALIAKKVELSGSEEKVYLCDTFAGVVKTSNKDPYYNDKAHSDTSLSVVESLISEIDVKNVKILKGVFPEETGLHIEDKKIKFCHIDVDVYHSAKDIFTWVWPKLVVGGILIFDDYGFKSCVGVTQLVNELKDRKDLFYVYNINGQAILIKRK